MWCLVPITCQRHEPICDLRRSLVEKVLPVVTYSKPFDRSASGTLADVTKLGLNVTTASAPKKPTCMQPNQTMTAKLVSAVIAVLVIATSAQETITAAETLATYNASDFVYVPSTTVTGAISVRCVGSTGTGRECCTLHST